MSVYVGIYWDPQWHPDRVDKKFVNTLTSQTWKWLDKKAVKVLIPIKLQFKSKKWIKNEYRFKCIKNKKIAMKFVSYHTNE